MLNLLGNALAPSFRDDFNARIKGDSTLTLLPASIGMFGSSEAFSEPTPEKPEDIDGQPIHILFQLGAVSDHDVNTLAQQLNFTVRTLKDHGAGPVWATLPFFAYSRQDRPFDDRMTSVGVKHFSEQLKEAGVVGVSTVEMHSDAGLNYMRESFGADQVFNLDPTSLYLADIENRIVADKIGVGGPDAGANARRDALANELGVHIYGYEKRHIAASDTEVTNFSGNVGGVTTITVDDMVDSGGTAVNSQVDLTKRGAVERYFYSAHAILSNNGLERLFNTKADDGTYATSHIVFLDTIDIGEKVARLKRQYGSEAVDARVHTISTSEMLFDHAKNVIQPHPAMRPG